MRPAQALHRRTRLGAHPPKTHPPRRGDRLRLPLGNIPYRNGGLFDVHELEKSDRYIYPAVCHGADKKLPPEIAVGLNTTSPNLIERRKTWNKPAPGEYALPTEIWRAVAALGGKARAVRQPHPSPLDLCERLGQAQDARAYNELITSWTGIESAASAAPKPTDGQLPGFET